VTGRAVARGVLARRGARRALDAGGARRRGARVPARAVARRAGPATSGLFHASPARPRVGVRPLRAAGRPVPGRHGRPRVARGPLPRGPGLRAPRRRARVGLPGPRGRGGGPDAAPASSSTRAASASPATGDPRAAWLLLDTDAASAAWQRTEYDIAGAQAAIRAAGLPDSLAERLGYGQ
jgi:hypothetical protein